MRFEPLNRHLLLSLVKEEKEEKKSTILVPEDYSETVRSRYETYGVVAIAKDCEKIPRDYIGEKVVVDNTMVEEINIKGQTYYLILENYIYGRFWG